MKYWKEVYHPCNLITILSLPGMTISENLIKDKVVMMEKNIDKTIS